MKKVWKKISIVCFFIVMLMAVPGIRVLADVSQGDDGDVSTPEMIVEPAENIDDGSGITVGSGVTATVDSETGKIELYSNGGILWNDWISKLDFEKNEITSISVAETSGTVYLPATCDSMFSGCMRLAELDLRGFDSSKVQYMRYMFSSCSRLAKLDFSGLDLSNVLSMQNTFTDCKGLTELNFRGVDTSKVTIMNNTFRNCSGLRELDLSSFNTANVTAMSGMFFGCENLTALNISSFNTSKVTSMGWMFARCRELSELDLSGFDTSKVDDFNSMFYYCMNLEELDLSSFTTRNLTDMGSMCSWCKKLKVLDLSNFDTSIVQNYTGVIDDCDMLQLLKTPKISDVPIPLPDTMYDEDGKAYSRMPILSKSIVLTRKIEEEPIGTPTPTPRIIATPTPITIATPTPTMMPTPAPVAYGFSDVQDPSHPFYKAIYWAEDNRITKGYSDGSFGINKSCTRGEMIMFLWSFMHKPEPKSVSKNPFSDVTKSHAFYKAVLWAYQNGITKGYSDGTFGINRKVSRGECMMFLWRVKGAPAPKAVSKSPFKDVAASNAFYKAILWGSQAEITSGYTSGTKKGTFGINENCTRGQIVTFLYRAR